MLAALVQGLLRGFGSAHAAATQKGPGVTTNGRHVLGQMPSALLS